MFNQTDKGREIRRAERVSEISDEDIQIALEMEKEGTPIPESLKESVEAYKAKTNPSKPDPDKDKDEEDEEGADTRPDDEDPDKKPDFKPSPVADDDKNKGGKKGKKSEGEDENEDDEGDVDPDKHSQRSIRAMPIDKFKAKKEVWKEREKELLDELNLTKSKLTEYEKAKGDDNTKRMEQILKDAAEKSGIDEDTLKTIFSSMEEVAVKPLQSKVLELEAAVKKASEGKEPTPEERQRKLDKDQDDKFDKEFDSTLKQSDADAEMAKHKKEIYDLAFTKGHETKSVWEIWTRFVKPKVATKKAPPESPTGQGGGTGGDKDWEEISKDPEKIKNLSITDAEKFQAYMGNKPRQIRRVR